jgi:hypothetical protein
MIWILRKYLMKIHKKKKKKNLKKVHSSKHYLDQFDMFSDSPINLDD